MTTAVTIEIDTRVPVGAATADSSEVVVAVDAVPGFSPAYATEGSAGADLKAHIDGPIDMQPGERALVPTGIRLAIPENHEGQIRPRSGLAVRHGVTVLNAPGTIDADYRGEVKVLLINTGDVTVRIEPGDRVAQLVIAPVTRASFRECELDQTDRGDGGFGSTGR